VQFKGAHSLMLYQLLFCRGTVSDVASPCESVSPSFR